VEQVLAKAPELDALLEVLVRRRDHPHVAAQRVVPAHAIELAVAQHAQQARLQVERHVADLVEEQRAAIGLLEAAAPRRLRAGEGAALVAEELALEQVLRDGRGVDGDERAARRAGCACAGARDELLARARLSGDEHRDDALAQAADGAEHVLHRGGLAEHFGHVGRARVAHVLAQALVDRTADQLDRPRHVERLGQVLEGAALESADRAVEVGVRRHDDHGQARMALLDLGQQVDARAAGHADVRHQHLRRLVVQRDQHVLGIGEAAHLEVLAGQRLLQHEADGLVVVNDPDRFHWLVSRQGTTILKTVLPGTLSHSIMPWCCCTNVCASVSPRPDPPSRPDTRG
jgi:hypothetical protein